METCDIVVLESRLRALDITMKKQFKKKVLAKLLAKLEPNKELWWISCSV